MAPRAPQASTTTATTTAEDNANNTPIVLRPGRLTNKQPVKKRRNGRPIKRGRQKGERIVPSPLRPPCCLQCRNAGFDKRFMLVDHLKGAQHQSGGEWVQKQPCQVCINSDINKYFVEHNEGGFTMKPGILRSPGCRRGARCEDCTKQFTSSYRNGNKCCADVHPLTNEIVLEYKTTAPDTPVAPAVDPVDPAADIVTEPTEPAVSDT
ncbi:hypothetical protein GQ42DRAFT_153240 [Ramicandelaber brevisporus]|nr:hypothetical protein GQ42DRAFT_153240 [Ramicandelaber brevisporus]